MKKTKALLVIMVLCIGQKNTAHAQLQKVTDQEVEISQILKKHNIPGAGIALISKDSVIWTRTLGLSNVKNNISVSENTLFATGSISKTVLAAVALIAQEQGLLDINDPIEQLVPTLSYQNDWNDTDPVRLIHLLEHTSGFDEAHFNLTAQANSYTPFSDVMKFGGKSLETRWRPGSYFEYNTFGYMLAAYIIEENVGMPFEEFVKINILTPLEMNQSTYHPKGSITPYFSKGYEGKEFKEVPFPDIPQWPAGTLVATIVDMANFVTMLLNNGRFKDRLVIDSSSINRMETPETSLLAAAGIQYGYGKGIWEKVEDGVLFYGHPGRVGGFLSEFGYSRELDVGYAILINNVDGRKAIKEIKRVLLSSFDHALEKEKPASTKANIAQISKIKGCYQPITSAPQLGKIGYFIYRLIDIQIISEENGQLYQSALFAESQALDHVKNLMFKNPTDPMATLAFVEDRNASWQWLTAEASYRKIPMWWGYAQFCMTAVCILIIVVAFISLFIWIPICLIRSKHENLLLQLYPFLAVCSLFAMVVSFITFYDPGKLYSAGAVLFLIFGWTFLLCSYIGLAKTILAFYRKEDIRIWSKYYALLTSLACSMVSSYLLYWGIIGLRLWDY